MRNFLTVSALVVLSACGGGGGGESPESSANDTPIANPGGLQNILAGTTVTLDGSGSTDANGDALTYSWTIVSKPAGSAASLINPASPKPTFQADVAGTYVASLVVNDGKVSSQAGTVTVTAAVANAAPMANAGTAQNVVTGTTVTLNGSGSSDANGDALTYVWTLTSRPVGSNATLSGANTVNPTFVADVAGSYVFSLVARDGSLNSTPATVTVTAAVANVAPVANAGTAQNVVTGTTVTLNGSGSSDANGDALSYAWTLTSKPAGSAASLINPASPKPTFQADVAGTYVASLVVNDGKVSSQAGTVTVTAAVANAAPVANAGTAQNTVTGTTVTLDGSGSSDANGDALTYAWTLTSRPVGSSATLSGANTVNPTFVADVAGSYVASLVARDGSLNSTPATVTVTAAVAKFVYTYKNPSSGSSRFGCWDFSFELFTNKLLSPSKLYTYQTSKNEIVSARSTLYDNCNPNGFKLSVPLLSDASAIKTDSFGNISSWVMYADGDSKLEGYKIYIQLQSANTLNEIIGTAIRKYNADQYSTWQYRPGLCAEWSTKGCLSAISENPSSSNSSWWTISELP